MGQTTDILQVWRMLRVPRVTCLAKRGGMAVELEMSVGSMDKNELYSWLIEEGIPEQFASILKGINLI